MVKRMEIHEDGQHVDLYFLNNSKLLNLDISGFAKLTPEELGQFVENVDPESA